jgi:ribonuclease Z
MRPSFQPDLVNGPFGDPGLYVDMLFERRALLFDLGDTAPLGPRKLLRLSDVFVSHTHMDHFIGFDRLLRVCLGRNAAIRIWGPPGLIGQVQHKLEAYTWNLVENYATDFVIIANDVEAGVRVSSAGFSCRRRFRREDLGSASMSGDVLLDDPLFRVRVAALDHRTPCLAYAIEEKAHVNVWKTRLAELGLGVGPWLRDLKQAVLRGAPGELRFRARWKEGGDCVEKEVPLAELTARVLRVVPGQKICYVTDAAYNDRNVAAICELARGADLLFIEAVFLQADAAHAARKAHLTAHQAGEIARAAAAKAVIPFHFSPRYQDREAALRDELASAFGGKRGPEPLT